jgi:hypothetical protein
MSDPSIFMVKEKEPTINELEVALGSTYSFWQKIVVKVYSFYPDGKPEWNFPGKNYGWSFRIKDKRRAILYLLPRKGYFKAAFIFGDKAVAHIMQTNISEKIKTALQEARKYAEGRGVQIDINSAEDMTDIPQLIEIKLAH